MLCLGFGELIEAFVRLHGICKVHYLLDALGAKHLARLLQKILALAQDIDERAQLLYRLRQVVDGVLYLGIFQVVVYILEKGRYLEVILRELNETAEVFVEL